MPPVTEEEDAVSREITRRLEEMIIRQRQLNLSRAVVLAQQAARGTGPLVEHFAELGRRYAHLVDEPPRPALRVIDGGAD
jgi:hypothetical protein